MKFDEFRQHCSRWMMEYSDGFNLLTKPHAFEDRCFHVRLHTPEFDTFSTFLERGNVLIVIASEYWKEDHVHLICYWRFSVLQEEWESIKCFENLRSVLFNFVLFRDRHDAFCPNEAFSSPEDFVVRFQYLNNFSEIPTDPKCVSFDFLGEDGKRIPKCLECCMLSHQRRPLWRRYVHEQFDMIFVKSPANWCRSCKRKPLFQILSESQLQEMYGPLTDVVLKLDCFLKEGKRSWRTDSPESKEEFVSKYDSKFLTEWFQGKDFIEDQVVFQFAGYEGSDLYRYYLKRKLLYGY